MNVLVVGGTGQVGSLVAAGMQRLGHAVSVLARNANTTLPPGQRAVIGDLLDVGALRKGLERCDALFAMLPPIEAMTFAGINLVALAREAGVANTVLMTGQDCRAHVRVAHIGSLVPIEDALAASGLAHTILNPNYFFQNDLRHKESIMGGLYPTPIGMKGLSRVDVRDIADAAVTMLCQEGRGERLRVCGPDVLSGEDVAAAWGQALNRRVAYIGDDNMADYELSLARVRSSAFALDLRLMYESFQRTGLIATLADVVRLTEVLGRPPKSFSAYTREIARDWAASLG